MKSNYKNPMVIAEIGCNHKGEIETEIVKIQENKGVINKKILMCLRIIR
jgi:sialic acid synthase SpsE